MNHAAMLRRVQAAERRVAEQMAAVQTQVQTLKHDTRAAITPLRIVAGGLVGGFALGLAAPFTHVARLANVPRLLQLATGVVGFINALRVQQAAQDTEQAAAEVSEASQRIDESTE